MSALGPLTNDMDLPVEAERLGLDNWSVNNHCYGEVHELKDYARRLGSGQIGIRRLWSG